MELMIMIRCYNTKVVVDSDKLSSIELTTRNNTRDGDQSMIWFKKKNIIKCKVHCQAKINIDSIKH